MTCTKIGDGIDIRCIHYNVALQEDIGHENKVINCTFTHHELYHIAFFVFWTFEIRQVWHNNHLVLIGWLEQSFLLCVPRNSYVYTSMFVFQLPVSKVGTNNSFLFGMFNKSLFTVIHVNRLNQHTCNTKQKLQIKKLVLIVWLFYA